MMSVTFFCKDHNKQYPLFWFHCLVRVLRLSSTIQQYQSGTSNFFDFLCVQIACKSNYWLVVLDFEFKALYVFLICSNLQIRTSCISLFSRIRLKLDITVITILFHLINLLQQLKLMILMLIKTIHSPFLIGFCLYFHRRFDFHLKRTVVQSILEAS